MTTIPNRLRTFPRTGLALVTFASIGLGVLALAACSKDSPSGAAGAGGGPGSASGDAAASASGGPVTVTLLVTADENGALVPSEDGKGGAAKLLGAWTTLEHHCAGPLKAGGAPACPEDGTIALSGGDHFSGAPISNLFGGEPASAAMAKIGYAASALGNHDLDFDRASFARFAHDDGFPYVAANAKTVEPFPKVSLAPFVTIERKGAKVAVVGLASETTTKTAMANRFDGLEVSAYEPALAKAIPEAWASGADALVVLAHECPEVLQPIIEKHADWHVALVTGSHCQKPFEAKAGDTVLASPGRRFESYLRAELKIDPSKPARERVVSVSSKRVEVGKDAPVDPALAGVVNGWKSKLDASLGEEIGYTAKALDKTSPELGKWVAAAVRDAAKADVGIVNEKGIKQGVPAGAIKASDVHAALPYENSVLLMKVSGEDLIANLKNAHAIYSGVKSTKPGVFTTEKGEAIDPKKTYSVATVDYLYFGGDGFTFEKADPLPTETGMVWQTAVIEYAKKLKSSKTSPLETKLH
jgi:5'-nucleotidase/UDP-sugar diphosphatase